MRLWAVFLDIFREAEVGFLAVDSDLVFEEAEDADWVVDLEGFISIILLTLPGGGGRLICSFASLVRFVLVLLVGLVFGDGGVYSDSEEDRVLSKAEGGSLRSRSNDMAFEPSCACISVEAMGVGS